MSRYDGRISVLWRIRLTPGPGLRGAGTPKSGERKPGRISALSAEILPEPLIFSPFPRDGVGGMGDCHNFEMHPLRRSGTPEVTGNYYLGWICTLCEQIQRFIWFRGSEDEVRNQRVSRSNNRIIMKESCLGVCVCGVGKPAAHTPLFPWKRYNQLRTRIPNG